VGPIEALKLTDTTADFFDGGRLPEAFGGYERSVTKYPVQYPTVCSPQAWSTGAPLFRLPRPCAQPTSSGATSLGRPPR